MNKPISSITYCQKIALVTLPEVQGDTRIVAEILTSIAENGVNVDMISQTAPLGADISISFTISDRQLPKLLTAVSALKAVYPSLRCEITPGLNKFTFYDEKMVDTPGVAARVLTLMAGVNTQIMMISTSTVDISILVDDAHSFELMRLCKESFGILPSEVAFD